MGTLSLVLAPGSVEDPVTHGVRPDTGCEAGAHVTTVSGASESRFSSADWVDTGVSSSQEKLTWPEL